MSSFDFAAHAQYVIKQMKMLEAFVLPRRKSYALNWKEIERLALSSKISDWDTLLPFKELRTNKICPVIYYFLIDKAAGKTMYDLFQKGKRTSIDLQIKRGISIEAYRSISHVPKEYNRSACLYVGSRKKDAHTRLKQHLGCGSKQTGALHLTEVFREEKKKPNILFCYHLLDSKYKPLTEHIEYVVQKKLKPILGRPSFKE